MAGDTSPHIHHQPHAPPPPPHMSHLLFSPFARSPISPHPPPATALDLLSPPRCCCSRYTPSAGLELSIRRRHPRAANVGPARAALASPSPMSRPRPPLDPAAP